MRVFGFLRSSLSSILRTLLLLVVFAGLFVTYRIVTFGQVDDADRMKTKDK